MKKRLLLLIILVASALVCGLLLTRREPASVTLPDGSTARIIAVTYGKSHVVHSRLSAITSHLPVSWQIFLIKKSDRRFMPLAELPSNTPQLVVWLEHRAKDPGAVPGGFDCMAFLGNGSNFVSGQMQGMTGFTFPSRSIQLIGLHFPAFPRRDREINLNFFKYDPNGTVRSHGTLSFANPQFRSYPKWQPESLPATKRVGNVDVTLSAFETGFGNAVMIASDRRGSVVTFSTNRDMRNFSAVDLKLKPVAESSESWTVTSVQFSDATGNVVSTAYPSWNGQNSRFKFEPSLWPDEPAWKVKFTLKKTQGFAPDELTVFPHVPLGTVNQTNILGWTTNVGGVTLTLREICRKPPATNNDFTPIQLSEVRLDHSPLPEGIALEMREAVYDNGTTNQHVAWSSQGDTHCAFLFREFPANAQTADLVFTVKKLLSVEFVVKPELPNVMANKQK